MEKAKQQNSGEKPEQFVSENGAADGAEGGAPFPTAIISRRAAEQLRAGRVWVYRTEIEALRPESGAEEIPAGSLAFVVDGRGALLGTALYSSSSMIALRMVSRDGIESRGEFLQLLRERMQRAMEMRRDWMADAPDTNACRLVFSEADELPGIVLDRYGELVILQLLTQGTYQDDVRAAVVETVLQEPGSRGVATIVERPDPRIRELEKLAAPPDAPLYANDVDRPKLATVFTLNGLRFHFDANAGQKTGAFLDQRENYAAAARYGYGRALDVCTYQGGFALHLARRCGQVTGVDVSRAALEIAERNLDENRSELVEHGRGVEWIEASAFELLRDWSDGGEEFDTIVLDPPAFAKSKRAAESALRGYKEMNLRALKMLRRGGVLVTCSCSHHVPLAEFQAVVAAAAGDAGKRVRLLEIRGAALDHPAILTLPETHYLKCLICRVE
jgi:23S rRNA (cytosine1962-C5)-methyltransferase